MRWDNNGIGRVQKNDKVVRGTEVGRKGWEMGGADEGKKV